MKNKATAPAKFESVAQPGLYFWAEQTEQFTPNSTPCFAIIAQADGYPATEACDDWFMTRADAEEVARQLAGISSKTETPAL